MNEDKKHSTEITQKDIDEALSAVPEEKREIIYTAIYSQTSTYSGPLPAPEDLKRYDEVVAGAAERILRMAEENAEHRRQMERRVIFSGT